MKIKKLHPDAVVPTYSTAGAAGLDLRARLDEPVFVNPGQTIMVGTGLAVAVPKGHMLMAAPRSGLGSKDGIVLGNLVGIIDSDYRGEIMVALWNRKLDSQAFKVSPGDRIVQAIVVPVVQVELDVVDELDETDRGAGGFGHTGTA
jgi:dUTP pyrophosphatase